MADVPRTRIPRECRSGFSLIEMLVVLGVIGILASLLMPAVQAARAAAQRVRCQNQLHQLAVALHNYHDVHATFPPGSLVMGPSFPTLSGWGWGSMLLPHLEQSSLSRQVDFNIGTAVGHNRELIRLTLPYDHCPSDPAPERISVLLTGSGGAAMEVAAGNYCGVEAVLSGMSRIRAGDVTDGLSQTLMVGERIYQPGGAGSLEYTSSWCGQIATGTGYEFQSIPHLAAVREFPINMAPQVANCFSSHHAGGAQFALGDGAVRLFSESIDLDVYQALGTRSGGDQANF